MVHVQVGQETAADADQETGRDTGRRTAASNDARKASRGRVRRAVPNVVLALVAIYIAGFLLAVWTDFDPLNPSNARLTPQAHPLFFPTLAIHIVACTVVVVSSLLQLWPWLRRNHLRIHRLSGRLYVFAGVWPAGLTALMLALFWPRTALTQFRDVPVSVLWLAITTYGYLLARQGRIADHRRWMLRSFALSTPLTVIGPLMSPIVDGMLRPELHSMFGGSVKIMNQMSAVTRLWLSLFIVLISVEWWLDRDRLRRSKRRARRSPRGEIHDGRDIDRIVTLDEAAG